MGVLLQGFYQRGNNGVPSLGDGDHIDAWWDHLAKQANQFRKAGFTAIWLPPLTKGGSGKDSVGYDVFDDYDLGSKNQKGFTVQAQGPRALGSSGEGLAYALYPFDQTNTSAQIPRSVALAFNIVDNILSLWRNGVVGVPQIAGITDLGTHGTALNRGNPLFLTVSFSHATKALTTTVQDTVTMNTTGPLPISNIDIPGFLKLATPALAYIGFTGNRESRAAAA